VGLTVGKYRALLRLATGRSAEIRVGKATVTVDDLFGLGTLLASVVDVGFVARHSAIARTDPVIVDVGANIGQFCVASKLFWPDAQVTSFEPDPDVFASLVVNTQDLSGVTTINVGLGAESGVLPWHRHRLSVMSSFRPRSDSSASSGQPDDERLLAVRRLDDVAGHLGEVDLLKVDVEGFEFEVLSGGRELLSRTRKLVVETSFQQAHGPSNLELFELVLGSSRTARIVAVGRVYGSRQEPLCADVLIDMRDASKA
jgi:FkbM family methyltransferase